MPGVLGGKAFAFKNVSEVPAAGGADDFHALPVRIGTPDDGSGDGLVEGGPAAAGIEFVLGVVQGRPAASAGIGSVGLVVPVAAAERGFRRTVGNDLFFIVGQGSHDASLNASYAREVCLFVKMAMSGWRERPGAESRKPIMHCGL